MKRMFSKSQSTSLRDPEDEREIDFSNAVLYICALQTILAVVVSACVSVLSCALLPSDAVSAIRTLVLCSASGAVVVRRPLRLGRAKGIVTIFNSLRPCAGLYVVALVLEQLVHSCARDAAAPSWRRFIFHTMTLIQVASGFARARLPLAETDLPFLTTTASLLVVALLPPPAVVLAGPLCAAPSIASSAERVVRAFVFALLYCVFVYASAPPTHANCDVAVCVMRASAASLWTLGCHFLFLPLAVLQIGLVVWVRVSITDTLTTSLPSPRNAENNGNYSPIGADNDLVVDGSTELLPTVDVEATVTTTTTPAQPSPGADEPVVVGDVVVPMFNALGARKLIDISSNAVPLSAEQMAAIAGRI